VDKPDEFIVGWELNGCRAIFEQDDATGYLYLANSEKILHALHVYNRKPALNVAEQDVEVIWTDSGAGVASRFSESCAASLASTGRYIGLQM
jgi:hypothetical protein